MIDEVKARLTVADLCDHHGIELRGNRAPCPIHGGNNKEGFAVYGDNLSRWKCFTRDCGAGDVISLHQQLTGLEFKQAIKELAGIAGVVSSGNLSKYTPKPKTFIRSVETATPPNATWRAEMLKFIAYAQSQLRHPDNRHAMQYLKSERLLNDDTINQAQLGYNPKPIFIPRKRLGLPTENKKGETLKDVYIPAGYTIPTRIEGTLWQINMRRTNKAEIEERGKYQKVKSDISKNANPIYGAGTLPYYKSAIMLEGELDTMLLYQECADLCAMFTTGGATMGVNYQTFGHLFTGVSRVFVALDNDKAGRKNTAKRLQDVLGAVPAYIPSHTKNDKDITDLAQSSGLKSVRNWTKSVLGV